MDHSLTTAGTEDQLNFHIYLVLSNHCNQLLFLHVNNWEQQVLWEAERDSPAF